ICIFGHADPVGDDVTNKQLSGRRAAAIYALLTRKTEIWEDLYSNTGKFASKFSKDSWGLEVVQIIMEHLGLAPGNTDGKMDDATKTALTAFQEKNGITPGTGKNDAPTREKLFLAYMDALCTPEFKLKESDFVAQGADPLGKGEYQGCGEFNPV